MENINKIFENNTIYDYSLSEISIKENLVEGNIKSDLVVFYSGELKSNQKEFMMKMLGAVKYNIENTLIISDKSKIIFSQIVKKGKANKIMFFGTTRKAVGLNLNLKRYKIFNIQGIDCLFIDDLDTIQNDTKRKSYLWNLMKTMFNV